MDPFLGYKTWIPQKWPFQWHLGTRPNIHHHLEATFASSLGSLPVKAPRECWWFQQVKFHPAPHCNRCATPRFGFVSFKQNNVHYQLSLFTCICMYCIVYIYISIFLLILCRLCVCNHKILEVWAPNHHHFAEVNLLVHHANCYRIANLKAHGSNWFLFPKRFPLFLFGLHHRWDRFQ